MKYSNKKWFIQFRNCLANLVEPGAHSIKTRVAKCLLKWFSVENDSQVFNGAACCDIHWSGLARGRERHFRTARAAKVSILRNWVENAVALW